MKQFRQVPTTRLVGDYVLTAEYDMTPGEPSVPVLTAVTVALNPEVAGEAAMRRGITSGSLRRVEGAVRDLAAAAEGEGASLRWGYARRAEAAMTALEGRSPRGDGTFYRDLLDAANLLVLSGDDQSVMTLATRLGRPRNTVANQLVTARRQREDAIRAEGAV